MERILVGQFRQESHSFVPGLTDIADFEENLVRRGKDSLQRSGNRELDGFLDSTEEFGVELVPTIDAGAHSGPVVSDAAFEKFVGEILEGIRANLDSIDGVMLGLHGAMVTESLDDAEGEILARVRAIVGPDMPVASTFDLHTHMTPKMADNATIVVGYQTCPHVDLRRAGRHAMDLLIRTIRGEVTPSIAIRKIPMLTSSEPHDDREFPNKEVIGMLHTAEEDPAILSASIFCTQPWLDISGIGWTAVVVTDANDDLGQTTADAIARRAWDLRDNYLVPKTDVDEAIDTALAGEGLFAFSEGSDSTTAGGLGDGNLLLKALLRRKVDVPTAVMVRDPEAAAACVSAGIGGVVTTTLGGKLNPDFYSPLEVTGTVRTLTDGHYLNHYGGIRTLEMGPTAVLQVGSIAIMITTGKPRMVDYEAYKSVGINPDLLRIIQPKSAGAYREYYDKIATCIDIDFPGPSGSDLTALPFTRIPRPMWPWDRDLTEPW
jgi:microcystin degradation protein MlrC